MEEVRRWMRLDNAAKIYPAARTRRWNNMFRLSVTMCDPIDPELLQEALDRVVVRFPSICVKLCRGIFWYYLEECSSAPKVAEETTCPCSYMPFSSLRKCALRVLYYKNRIAVEYYHSVTDGTGGTIFLKTLAAEYIRLRYKIDVQPGFGVLDINEPAKESELEDSFLRYAGDTAEDRDSEQAYRLQGTRDSDCWNNVITGIVDLAAVKQKAKEYSATVNEYLVAVMLCSIAEIQARGEKNRRRAKPLKVLVPINLRRYFESETLRNFTLFVSPRIDRRKGDYSFEEVIEQVHHQICAALNKKDLGAKFTANVRSEKSPILRALPLFIKNIGMKLVYKVQGETTSCINLSNLGLVRVPKEMEQYIERFDFVLGAQASQVNNCGVAGYGSKLMITFTRTIVEPTLEKEFFALLRKHGIVAKVESNQQCITTEV